MLDDATILLIRTFNNLGGEEEKLVKLDQLLDGNCMYPNCSNPGETYHQTTAYVNLIDNYICLCPEHKELNDKEWADRWQEYYSGLLEES